MDINYELYKVFYYVARTLSFSEASKCLFISQSAVSQSVKVLEKKLGQTLFIRTGQFRFDLRFSGEDLLQSFFHCHSPFQSSLSLSSSFRLASSASAVR